MITLRQRREQRGLTQRQAAEQLGVSQKTVSNWESGLSNPDHEGYQALAVAYGCDPADLMPRAPRNQYPSAPNEPESRLDWVRRRNAAIQHVDVDEYMEIMRAQDERTDERAKEST